MTINEFITAQRERKGLSIDGLVEESGVSRATIYRMEAGKDLDIKSLERLTLALGYKLSAALKKCGK
jgi:predicted transcriptional regulator